MGYTEDEHMVRVDFFRPSMKWYCTEAVRWKTWEGKLDNGGKLIHVAFAEALKEHLGFSKPRLNGMVAVCLEPYHEFAHPVMLTVGDRCWWGNT